jgi:hypothetical protein
MFNTNLQLKIDRLFAKSYQKSRNILTKQILLSIFTHFLSSVNVITFGPAQSDHIKRL